jgi:hypothetical protein
MVILAAMSLAWAIEKLSPVVTRTASKTVNTLRTGQSVMAWTTMTANLSKTRRSKTQLLAETQQRRHQQRI